MQIIESKDGLAWKIGAVLLIVAFVAINLWLLAESGDKKIAQPANVSSLLQADLAALAKSGSAKSAPYAIGDVKNDFADLRRDLVTMAKAGATTQRDVRLLGADITGLKNDLAMMATKDDVLSLGGDITSLKDGMATMATKNDLASAMAAVGSKISTFEISLRSEIVRKQTVEAVVQKPDETVGILLLDESGRVPEAFLGVPKKSISRSGKCTQFMFDGKPIIWNGEVAISYPHSSTTGSIVYNPAPGETAKVINVAPHNVFPSDDGTLRYNDGKGGFPCAPKGSGYITAQSELPSQQ